MGDARATVRGGTPRSRTAALDLVVVLAVVGVAVLERAHVVDPLGPLDPAGLIVRTGGVLSVLAIALAGCQAWDPRRIESVRGELSALAQAHLFTAFVVALAAVVLDVPLLRDWVVVVLPASLVLMAFVRVARRTWRGRRQDLHGVRVLVLGGEDEVADLVGRIRRTPERGWEVVAACTVTGDGEIAGVPVVGGLDAASVVARDGGVDLVVATSAPGWSSRRLRKLGWDLEGSGIALVVDPGLMEIGHPRLGIVAVGGAPLLRVSEPRFHGSARVLKTSLDVLLAGTALVVLSPLFLVVAAVVRLEDGSPVFYRQVRVGRDGDEFRMIKFRSMVVDADRRLDELRDASDVDGPLFKMRADPRVTRVGAVLRRWSIDELPQLFNVLAGSMSLVGPRPPLPGEVDRYAEDARRRLLVRPGLTGPWQVGGRSDLSWEDSLRLDLNYVENWSPGLDLVILARTLSAVLHGRGAY